MTNAIRQTRVLPCIGLCLLIACNPTKVDIIKEPYTDVQAKITGMLTEIFNTAKAGDFVRLDAISYSGKVQGNPVADAAHGSLIFVNYEDKWRITHEHFSKFK